MVDAAVVGEEVATGEKRSERRTWRPSVSQEVLASWDPVHMSVAGEAMGDAVAEVDGAAAAAVAPILVSECSLDDFMYNPLRATAFSS